MNSSYSTFDTPSPSRTCSMESIEKVGIPGVDIRFTAGECTRLLHPGSPRHHWLRVGLLHSWPDLIPRQLYLCAPPNTVLHNHDLMKARHQRPQMRPAMLGFAAPGRSDRHVAICDTGDANPPPSPTLGPMRAHIKPTVRPQPHISRGSRF